MLTDSPCVQNDLIGSGCIEARLGCLWDQTKQFGNPCVGGGFNSSSTMSMIYIYIRYLLKFSFFLKLLIKMWFWNFIANCVEMFVDVFFYKQNEQV